MKTIEVTFEQLRYPNDWLLAEGTTMEAVQAVVMDMLDNPAHYEALLSKNM